MTKSQRIEKIRNDLAEKCKIHGTSPTRARLIYELAKHLAAAHPDKTLEGDAACAIMQFSSEIVAFESCHGFPDSPVKCSS